jgi:hypothetical protein
VLPRIVIPHHANAKSNTTTKPWANNLATIWRRGSLLGLAWKLVLLSREALMPRRGTHSDDLAMNLRMNRLTKAYSRSAWKGNSAKFAGKEFSEVHSR